MNTRPSPLPWILIAVVILVGSLYAFNRLTRTTPGSTGPGTEPVVPLSRTPRPESAQPLPALHAAAAKGDAAALQSLCARGTDTDTRDPLGRTPLMIACLNGSTASASILLSAGSSPMLADSQGATAIYFAAGKEGCAELVRALIEAGADVNAAASDQTTPLMRAAQAGDPARCILLLDAGASASAKDSAGRSAFDHARARNDEAGARCAAILEQAAS